MKVDSLAHLLRKFATTGISLRQINAGILLLTLMIPIAAPIPAWAYDLRLPAPPTEQVSDTSFSNPWPSFALVDASKKFVLSTATFLLSPFRDSDETVAKPGAKNEDRREAEVRRESSIDTEVPDAGDTDGSETVEPVESESKEKIEAHSASTVPLVEFSDQEVRDSTYDAENNLGSPPNQTEMDAPNLTAATKIKHRAGIANYSFGVPFASLPGRGIDASVGMTYNSRLWNKTGDGANASYQFNVDQNWLAPGFTMGYGALKSHFSSKTVLLTNNQYKTYNEVIPDGFTDADGTRHQFECKTMSPIPGTQSNGGTNTFCSEYGTADGTFIKVTYHGNRPLSGGYNGPDDMSAYASTFFTLTFTDGTKINYSVPGAQFASNDFSREHYPVQIQDPNGNQIDVVYKDGKNSIDHIRDTLGRDIKFYYDSADSTKLVAVTVPGFDGNSERQTIRFYYEDLSLNFAGKFSGYPTGPTSYRALRYVYFPSTGSGYKYDYHPNFGMITRIAKLTGMTVSGGAVLNSMGSVNTGFTQAATTEYLYPNDGSPTPLTDVPRYTARTDAWLDYPNSRTATTEYDAPEPAAGADRVSKTTVHDTGFDVKYESTSFNTGDWMNGLPKEARITKVQGLGGTPMAITNYTWNQTAPDANGHRYPMLVKTEITNDAGQVQQTTFEYDSYLNQKKIHEFDFTTSGETPVELRRTETDYVDDPLWTNNNLVRLPKEIRKVVGGHNVSKVVYEYDNYSPLGMEPTPNVVQHNPDYDPNSGTHYCGFHYVCGPGEFPPRDCERVDDYCPNHDPSTDIRGNVTKVISFANAEAATVQADPNALQKTLSYDITGNVVGVAGMSCCNVKTIEYSPQYQYAYPTKETKGGTTQLITKASYDFNTGAPAETRDENDLPTRYIFDSATMRQTRVEYPNGAWTSVDFNDTTFPYSVKTTSSLDDSRSVSTWNFFNGAGQTFRSRRLTASGYLSSDVEFDRLGRAVKTFNPYTVTNLGDPRPSGTKSSEITQFDALGRVLQTKLQDDTTVINDYTGTITTMTDQAGKKRRQVADALGRIRRVDEPDLTGDLGIITSPKQPTYYDYDGNDNLSKVTQTEGSIPPQERTFEYDSLSRLLRERQVEATPTLDAAGVKGTSSPTKWTGVYKYSEDGLLDFGIDARGVRTKFSYDGLNRIKRVEYEGEVGYTTPIIDYTYDEARTDPVLGTFYNTGRLTTIATREISIVGGQFTPKTSQKLDYDKAGQVTNHNQTIDQQSYNLQYGYNLAGQMTSEKYPSGKVVNMTVDNYGVTQTIADQQRTYVNGVTSAYTTSGMTSQTTLGNGTVENYTFNERFQLTSQNLMRGSEVLQKYNYNYADRDASGNLKNNGKLEQIESFIGSAKQRTQKFSYDSIGRLKQSEEYRGDTGALTYKQVFDFDSFGNLYRKAGSNPTIGQQNPLPFTPIEDTDINKSKNQFATGTTYDEAGQVINDTKFRSMGFSYDANGRVVKATKANTPDAHTVYDALGKRVATKISNVWHYMIYDSFGKLVAEYGAPSEGLGGLTYIQQDHQGSVRTITNSNGSVVGRIDHQAFGEPVVAGVGLRKSNQGYGADGTMRQGYGLTEKDDATGQEHTWFRKLETQAGRWSSPDPYKGSMNVGDPQSFNRYAYVGSEPTNYVDPSGLMCSFNPNWEDPSEALTNCWEPAYGGRWGGFDADHPIREPHGPDSPPLSDTCTLTVYVSGISLSSGSSSGQDNRENPPEGRVGIINHLYLTYQDSSSGLTVGVRAGPVTDQATGTDYLTGSFGLYEKGGFKDFEINPKAAAIEVYGEKCDNLDKSLKETVSGLDKAKIKYSKTGNNSNAFLYTALNRAGIDANSFTPRINAVLGYLGTAPGWGTTVPIP